MTRKGHRKLLIYCPELCKDSFLHLDIQGDSYALRRYLESYDGSVKIKRWKDPQSSATDDLLLRYRFVHQIDVLDERENLDTKRQYWMDRITALNRKHSIESDGDFEISGETTMFDSLSVSRQLTEAGLDRAQADVLAAAIRQAAEHGDYVTSDQFAAGLAALESRIYRAMLLQAGVIVGAVVAILRLMA